MSKFVRCIFHTLFWLSVVVAALSAFLFWAYQVKSEGTLYLPRATGTASITRETDTGIVHVRGATYDDAVYAQGFAHGQTRLWQMERTRRVIRGEISELFGEDTYQLDLFMRQVGFKRLAEKAWETMPKKHKKTLEAYANGVNDAVLGTSLIKKQGTQRLLPPEFYTFGISDLSEWRPWSPIDSLALVKYKSYYLSWNWMNDLARESLRQKHPDLADAAEEINPFTLEFMKDMVTIVDDDDLIKHGQYSEKTLTEKYAEAQETMRRASPSLPDDVPGVTLRADGGANSDTQANRLSVKAAKEARAAEQRKLDEEAKQAEQAKIALEKKQQEEAKLATAQAELVRQKEAAEQAAKQAVADAEAAMKAQKEAEAAKAAAEEAERQAKDTAEKEKAEKERAQASADKAEKERLAQEAKAQDEVKARAEAAEQEKQKAEAAAEKHRQELAKAKADAEAKEKQRAEAEAQAEIQRQELAKAKAEAEAKEKERIESERQRQEEQKKSYKLFWNLFQIFMSENTEDLEAKNKAEQIMEEQLEGIAGHTTASNNWVISGEHTANGMPMLSTDPHLGAVIPAFWQLNEIVWGEQYITGAALVGMPGIGMGRSEHLVWGMTAAIVDNSDLWEEELNEEGTQYLVDGKWRDLKVVKEVFKVKGKPDVKANIKFTHRGPIVETEQLRFQAALLFGGSVPNLPKSDYKYSFGWGGAYEGDSSFDFIENVNNAKNIPDLFFNLLCKTRILIDLFEKIEESTFSNGYRGIAVNLQVADNSGNIAYQLAVPMPKRKNQTPYLGCRVLDGRSSEFDWTDDLVPLDQLPRSINPTKGFISNANNRQVGDHASYDYGGTHMATGRSIRIDELIREGIAQGKKFTAEDMIAFQQDNMDVFARNMHPYVMKLAESMRSELSREDQEHLDSALNIYRGWDGSFEEDSVAASIHMHFNMDFYKSLFHKYEKDESERLLISDNYAFVQFYQRLLLEVDEQQDQSHFQKFCEKAHPEYKGVNYCAYNVAKSMADSHRTLSTNVSKRTEDWAWRNLHLKQFKNLPWSMTPLRFFFHREVPSAGNNNSLNIAGVKYRTNADNIYASLNFTR